MFLLKAFFFLLEETWATITRIHRIIFTLGCICTLDMRWRAVNFNKYLKTSNVCFIYVPVRLWLAGCVGGGGFTLSWRGRSEHVNLSFVENLRCSQLPRAARWEGVRYEPRAPATSKYPGGYGLINSLCPMRLHNFHPAHPLTSACTVLSLSNSNSLFLKKGTKHIYQHFHERVNIPFSSRQISVGRPFAKC